MSADPEDALHLCRVWWDGSNRTVERRESAVAALGLSALFDDEGSDFWDRFPSDTTLGHLERAAAEVAAGAPREWALRRLGAAVD